MSSQLELTPIELQEIAERIKVLRRRATEHAIEIGRELIAVKSRLPHGDFVKWVEAQCGFKIRMAQDLMKLTREAADNPDLAAMMTPSTLRIYVSNRSQRAVQDLVKARAIEGQRISRKELLGALGRAQTDRASANRQAPVHAAPKPPATPDLMTAGQIGADTEIDKAKKIAQLLVRRLSHTDLELIMDGMTWGVWNRVLVWLQSDIDVLARTTPATPTKRPSGALQVRAA
jgi:hypothetical protein